MREDVVETYADGNGGAASPLEIPEFCVVLLVGASGSGKSTFARRHFGAFESLTGDVYRGLVSDDVNSQDATSDAFAVMLKIAALRLSRRLRVVVDATNLRPEDRKVWIALAREQHCPTVAIVFDMPLSLCLQRNEMRDDRHLPPHVLERHVRLLRESRRNLAREGFRFVHVLSGESVASEARIAFTPLATDCREDRGPFDIVGDVHGCADEFEDLLGKLGYAVSWSGGERRRAAISHPDGRRVVLVGDVVDRGPRVADSLRLAAAVLEAGGHWVNGNHDDKLKRWILGRNVKIAHGLDVSIADLDAAERDEPGFKRDVAALLDSLPSHRWLDGGALAVAHAGITPGMIGRASGVVRQFCAYGATLGEDDSGLPIRVDWARDYRGATAVVYGHTPVVEPEWVNGTLCVDTGCVFGNALTALRWPEREIVSVPARAVHAEPSRPLIAPPSGRSAQAAADDVLAIAPFLGKRTIETSVPGYPRLTIPEDRAAAALEVATRFGADPRWLIHVPATMSPVDVSDRPDLLEHPDEAFSFYARSGVSRVFCEEKHMGSRAVAVVTRSPDVSRSRFGLDEDSPGCVMTRSGRQFFTDGAGMEGALLGRLREACEVSGLFRDLDTDWIAFDCELMPWSFKAGGLIGRQYAPVAATASLDLGAARDVFSRMAARGVEGAGELAEASGERLLRSDAFTEACLRYVAPVHGVDDLRLAPFAILASEGRVWLGEERETHWAAIDRLCLQDSTITATRRFALDPSDAVAAADAVRFWEEIVSRGGEGMVVKPARPFTGADGSRLALPGLKVRGADYLRLVYGPEYDAPGNLSRLRARDLGRKRSLAMREHVLGWEALRRFVLREPLWRVHDCVLGVIALETEPVDPRL